MTELKSPPRLSLVLIVLVATIATAEAQGPIQLVPNAATAPAKPADPKAAPVPAPNPGAQAKPAAPPVPTVRSTPVISAAIPLNPQQVELLQKVNSAFNTMHDMQATFLQVDNDGTRTTGRFFLTKPGKVRFQYDKPSPLEVIADGKDLVVRDRKLNTQDFYPLRQTPLRYLLNDKIDLTKDAKVLDVLQDPELVTIVIEDKTDFSQGQLALFFDTKTLELRQWSVIDGDGRETAVAVQNVTLNHPNKPDLFTILTLPTSGPR